MPEVAELVQKARPLCLAVSGSKTGPPPRSSRPLRRQPRRGCDPGRPRQIEQAIAACARAFQLTPQIASVRTAKSLTKYFGEDRRAPRTVRTHHGFEAGKPIKTARAEVDRAIFTLQRCSRRISSHGGEFLPLDLQEFTAGRWGIVRRFPAVPSPPSRRSIFLEPGGS